MLLPLLILFSIGTIERGVDLDVDIEGNIYVIDASRDMVFKYSPTGDSLGSIGGFGRGEREFDRPSGLFARLGTGVWVADRNNHRVQRYDRNFEFARSIRTRDSEEERIRFGYPLDVAVSRQGLLHILDGENRRVLVLGSSGGYVRTIGDVGSGEGMLREPTVLELDDRDDVYLLDGGRVRRYDPFGAWRGDLPFEGVRDFSIRHDTIALLGEDASLRLYAIGESGSIRGVKEGMGAVDENISVVLRVGRYVYTLGPTGLTVLEFATFAGDSATTQVPKESQNRLPASESGK